MSTKSLSICVLLVAAGISVYGQSRSKRVRQPREVVEAFRVCTEFRSLLAENLEFDHAFEATFTKDPTRRREIAISDAQPLRGDLSQVHTETLVRIYKDRVQLLILMLPLMFTGAEQPEAELFPPPIAAMFERKPPNDPANLKDYAAQLKRDVADFRAHVVNVASKNPEVAKNILGVKDFLLRPLELPNRTVKPLTAYSKGHVLPPAAKYYQIDDCAVVREEGR